MKRAFTLIEMVIAIAIFALAMTLLYENLDISKKFFSKTKEVYKKAEYKERVIKLLYQDFLNATDLKSDIDEKAVVFRTSNSIFHIPHPYVGYYNIKNRLYRVESIHPLKIVLSFNDLQNARVFPIDINISDFRVKIDKEKNILIYFKDEKEKEVLFVKNLK